MRGLNCRGLDFSRPEPRAPLAGLAAVVLLALLAVIGWRQWQLQRQEAEITVLEQGRERQRQLREREQRRLQARTPEERKLEALLLAQGDDGRRLRPALLRGIEQAWTPRLGMLTLHLEGAGRQARLELSAADPGAIFQFLSALNRGPGQATLLRQGIKADDPRRAALATIQVTLR
ncbi:hypothetical protein VI26_18475 [Chromobacterium sp. LK1]|uniref:hypothetical protein n=1 Tax=Chromobacterium sp. LK1 TaxID=1628193 RepID=UPI00065420B2|nr:hypothetical protein [Chromobacterium sp. LK1]KMN32140.1 hypothetical protein VI26_18475 [Chromobacterium sp. LK1]